ncbi:helix-turn-helix transcriptional regulator [Ferrimonas balearica]|uniref:helix-turn-helix transcriptional regulator n=1 Tax=Ferrimonas balearica TaxID=44012 RepID=UPI001C99ABED|nr:helix-turn-helix transcriptional regulator [Ferrimonas balearica]MBY5991164.1 helix-turn-helix transcriptional regulator [Ferrimonas balearica]
MNAEQVSNLIDTLYDCALKGLLPDFLHALAQATQSTKCFMILNGQIVLDPKGEQWREPMLAYFQEMASCPYFQQMKTTPLGQPLLLSERVRAKIKASKLEPYYQDSETEQILGVSQTLDGQLIGLSAHRADRRVEYDDAHVRLFKMIAPHLKRAVALQETFQPAYAREQALKAAVELCHQPVAVTDREGQLRACNAPFEAWLAGLGKSLLVVHHHHLEAKPQGLNMALTPLLAQGCCGRGGDIPLPRGRGVLRLLPVPASLGDRLVMLVVLLPQNPDLSWAIAMYDLSNKEYQVLSQLAAGQSLKEIAEHNFVSYNTVRTHIHHLLAKTHTHSQQELLSRVARYSH